MLDSCIHIQSILGLQSSFIVITDIKLFCNYSTQDVFTVDSISFSKNATLQSVLTSLSVLQSKGAVLSQACDYVQDTRGMQQKYMDLVHDNEKLLEDIKMLKQSNEALVTANQLLKAHLKSQGAVILEGDQSTGTH